MPEELKAEMSAAADISGRSLHAELLFRLGASIEHNRKESELLGARMRQQEARLETMKVKYEVANLARCVQFLVGLVEQAEVRLSKRDRELIEMANAAAEEGLLYETELNPELLLAEYQQTFNAARDMLKVWAPEYYPWPGTPEDSPKASKRIRKTAAKQLPSGST